MPHADTGITWSEFSYRAGLLLAAGLFLFEAFGSPFAPAAGLFAIASLLLSLLIVSTLAIQWRQLGDWRDPRNKVLLVLLTFVFTMLLTGALNPKLTGSALPAGVQEALTQAWNAFRMIPGVGMLAGFLRAMLSFLLLTILAIVLLLGTKPGRRAGVYIAAGFLAVLLVLFSPTLETMLALAFLGTFLATQWEFALLLAPRVRDSLSPAQLEYLETLARAGRLSPGETRLYLNDDAQAFAHLAELELVEYDKMFGEVLPGRRLLNDPTVAAFETLSGLLRRFAWVALGIVYFLLPDLLPGPIDDIIVMAICSGAGLGFFGGNPRVARRLPR